jgi:16S rRNA processing protein RimM
MSNIERTPVGRIVGAFGIKGQVKVEMITNFPARFDKGNDLFIDGVKYKIQASQFHKGRPLLKLSGIDTMSAAEALQWKILEAEGEPDLEEDEYLLEDLIGLKVITVEGEELGVVEDIEDYPAHEVILVGEIRIPLIDHFVKDIDIENEVMTVQLIYGMKPGEE